MKTEESTYELIERFLNEECSANEAKSIEERMATDQAFADEVDWFRQFRSDTKDRKSFALLAELERMKEEDATKRKRRVRVAVGILLLLLTMPLIWYTLQTFTTNKDLSPHVHIFSSEDFERQVPSWEQYLDYETGLQSLGDGATDLKEAQKRIEAGNPKAAIFFLEAYLNTLTAEDDDYEMRLEYGKILLKEQFDTEGAKANFRRILNSGALEVFKESAVFYLGLSHLLSGQQDSTRLVWQEIIKQTNHPFHQQAMEILNTNRSQ